MAGPGRNGRAEATPRARLLIVDHHAETRDLLDTVLKTAGYDVVLVEDGLAALQRYRGQRADVVLMDLAPPRGDGVPPLRDLSGAFPGATIVAMSGDAGAAWHDALAEARAAGAHLTVRKPLEPWVLLRTLEGLLAARKSLALAPLSPSA